jgi:hypothetical protein
MPSVVQIIAITIKHKIMYHYACFYNNIFIINFNIQRPVENSPFSGRDSKCVSITLLCRRKTIVEHSFL